jgi:hypothetical protein|tara:strand:+ start:221 stop:688 length:468 start_codon:yes stop_codon:yes gene_type:complete
MFRWSKNTKDWAETLLDNKKNSVIKIDFDLYYLFLLIGLGLGRSEVLDEKNSTDIIRYYPSKYIAQRHKIAMMLIYCDLKVSGFSTNEKNIVKSKIEEIITSDTVNLITGNAEKLLNNYANGGYEAVRERMNKVEPNDALFIKILYEEFFPQLFQ